MRLLHAKTVRFREFVGSNIPPYAILSHRWGDDEVTFNDVERDDTRGQAHRKGWEKVWQCCAQARKDGLEYVWIDTCCIDKSSSAELSEAINSMYEWYRNSTVCYAYLFDVLSSVDVEGALMMSNPFAAKSFQESQWFARGWTLQELIAPKSMKFFGSGGNGLSWVKLGEKRDLLPIISKRTGIDQETLRHRDLHKCSIAIRMSWASDRETTREEDMAYCLLGIFDVNMPLLYGEGAKAFIRLQEEIMRRTDDHSLFAWQSKPSTISSSLCGPLATSPSQFSRTQSLIQVPDLEAPTPYSMTNKGLMIQLPIVEGVGRNCIAILSCSPSGLAHDQIGLPLTRITAQESAYYARNGTKTGPLQSVTLEFAARALIRVIYLKQDPEKEVELRTGILARVREEGLSFYRPICIEPEAVAMRMDNQWRKLYSIPASQGHCSIILAGQDGSFLIVLANIALQNRDKYACKVLNFLPGTGHTGSERFLEQRHLLRELITNLKRIDAYEDHIVAYCPANKIALYKLYNDFWWSNSRYSFEHLPNDRAVYVKIEREMFRGGYVFVLDIVLQEQYPLNREPYELPSTELQVSVIDPESNSSDSPRHDSPKNEIIEH